MIKSKKSDYADCLESWKTCLQSKGKKINQKDFDKFWLSLYFRFDTCSSEDRNQAGRKCSGETAFKKDIWGFEHEVLDELKIFLELFR